MYLTLHQDNKPIIVNMSRVFYIEPTEGKYRALIVADSSSLLVDETVADIHYAIQPSYVLHVAKIADEKVDMDTPIEELDFTTRAMNILRWQKINTLGELVHKFPAKDTFARGLGTVTRREIENKVHCCGYLLAYEKGEA